MKSAAKLIRRFVSILLLSAVLLVIINVAVYAVLVSEKAPTETTSPYDIAEKAGEALQVLPDGTYCLSEEVSSELEEKNIWAIFIGFYCRDSPSSAPLASASSICAQKFSAPTLS